MSKLLKFYTQVNGTTLRCDKIKSLREVIATNIDELVKASNGVNGASLPLNIVVEQPILDKINHEVAVASCSKYRMNTVKIYASMNALFLKTNEVIVITAVKPILNSETKS